MWGCFVGFTHKTPPQTLSTVQSPKEPVFRITRTILRVLKIFGFQRGPIGIGVFAQDIEEIVSGGQSMGVADQVISQEGHEDICLDQITQFGEEVHAVQIDRVSVWKVSA